MPNRLGILGGTFDPIHIGHLIIASYASEAIGLGRVLFMPAQTPPHKSRGDISPAEHRVAMVNLAIAGDDRLELSDFDLRSDGPSFTSDLLARVHREHPSEELFFIAGADSLRDFPTWNEPQVILKHAHLAIASRPGTVVTDAMLAAVPDLRNRSTLFESPLIEVSSSGIRDRVRKGAAIRYLVPDEVQRYIRDRRLYLDAGT
ncbi:MAG TPA: nicotinate-nucleotide adenylyltransferase [Thermomicrobiales bacterium]|nr:nicotinate-nucleotide adenylyltransferase [Thermomicrobiales bacterium]